MENQNSSSIIDGSKWTTGTSYIDKRGLEDMGKSFKEALKDYHNKAFKALEIEVDLDRLPAPIENQKFYIKTELWYE